MLQADNTVLLLIDVQEKITNVMHDKSRLLDKLQRLIAGIDVLGIPMLATEQYPAGLGPTMPELHLDPEIVPVEKITFSCCDNPQFMDQLQALNRTTVLVAGIETHVCVYQTVRQLLTRNYSVEVVTDAVDSRNLSDREIALQRMRDEGAGMTTVEMVLFELLKKAGDDTFKAISGIIK